MINAISGMISAPEYKPIIWLEPNKTPTTYCNVAVRDLLDMTYTSPSGRLGGRLAYRDYDIGILDRNRTVRDLILDTPIQEYYDLALEATNNKLIRQVFSFDIPTLLKRGEMIHLIDKNKDHEACIAGVTKYSNTYTIVVGQCGLRCGFFDLQSVWSFYGEIMGDTILAVVYPLRMEGLTIL